MPDDWEVVQDGRPLSLNELALAAKELMDRCRTIKVWLFSGELGAGKTTLVKALAASLGVTEGMSSPTFSIVNEYAASGQEKVYHFDFYRLKNEREAFDIGTEEYFDSGSFCFVEWPDRIPSLIPDQRVEIKILPDADPERRVIQFARYD